MPVNVSIDVTPGTVPANPQTPIAVSYGNLSTAPNTPLISLQPQESKGSVKLRFAKGSAKEGTVRWKLPPGWIFVSGSSVFSPRQGSAPNSWGASTNPQGNVLMVPFDFSGQPEGTQWSWDHQYKVQKSSSGVAYDVDPEIENDN
ncbi:MAG: hypothetical protein RLZZ188_2942 [Verrucomicrobiota bacterium]|jgi:hypothetical protein